MGLAGWMVLNVLLAFAVVGILIIVADLCRALNHIDSLNDVEDLDPYNEYSEYDSPQDQQDPPQ